MHCWVPSGIWRNGCHRRHPWAFPSAGRCSSNWRRVAARPGIEGHVLALGLEQVVRGRASMRGTNPVPDPAPLRKGVHRKRLVLILQGIQAASPSMFPRPWPAGPPQPDRRKAELFSSSLFSVGCSGREASGSNRAGSQSRHVHSHGWASNPAQIRRRHLPHGFAEVLPKQNGDSGMSGRARCGQTTFRASASGFWRGVPELVFWRSLSSKMGP